MSSPLEAGPQLARQRYAVMATLRPDGSPHLSLVQQHHSGAEAAVSSPRIG